MTAKELFQKKCIIGMVHCLPLPGTKDYDGDMERVRRQALADADTLAKGGVDAVIVENMNDSPMAAEMDIEQTAALAAVSMLVRERLSIPVGIDAAFCDYKAGLSIAAAVGADFVRIPVFVDMVMTAAGIIPPCAREAIRFRKQLNAENIAMLCDIQVKHSYMVVKDITLEDSAVMAEQNGADAIIVTGSHTGQAAPIDMIKKVKRLVSVPVLAGSGFNAANAAQQIDVIDGAIVGSAFKEGGILTSPVQYTLVEKTMNAVNAARK